MIAVVLEGFLIAGTVTMLAGFCVGTFVFHLVRGQVGFAMRTLPWLPTADQCTAGRRAASTCRFRGRSG